MSVWPAVAAMVQPVVLGQQGVAQRSMREVLWWGGGLLVAALLVGAGIAALRRRTFPKQERPLDQAWSLGDLRRMRETGELSAEEFETLRAGLIAELGGVGDPKQVPPARAGKKGSN